jgi:hypothetical protein
VVYTFDNTHECNPEPYLTQGTDGKLYGLTNAGGAHGNRTFFSLNVGLAPFASLLPSSGKVGSKIGILGQGFSASSIVKFNGVKATTVVGRVCKSEPISRLESQFGDLAPTAK